MPVLGRVAPWFVVLVLLARTARADPPPAMGDAAMGEPAMGEPSAGAGKDAPPALVTVPDAEAGVLVENLKKAGRAKTPADAMPAFDALAGKTHPSLEPVLQKLIANDQTAIASRAAKELGLRSGPKTPAFLARAYAAEDKRPSVKGAILEAMGTAKVALDAKAFEDVTATWKSKLTDMTWNDWYVGVARYFATVATDKRACRFLGEFLDEPIQSGDVDVASNPPAEWWEKRWKQWNVVHPEVEKALKAITGQSFHRTADAKAWFQKNPEFGVTWFG